MGNCEIEVPAHVKDEWVQFQRNGRQYLLNLASREEFHLVKLNIQPEAALLQRSAYPLPCTPKILIAPGKDCSYLLVQQSASSLSDFLQQSPLLLNILIYLKNTLMAIQGLRLRYGSFGLTEKMLGFDRFGSPLVWINEAKGLNIIQNSLSNNQNAQKLMIHQLLHAFRKHSPFVLGDSLQAGNCNTIESFLVLVDAEIKKQSDRIDKIRFTKSPFRERTKSPVHIDKKVTVFFKRSPQKDALDLSQKRKDPVPKFILSKKALNHRADNEQKSHMASLQSSSGHMKKDVTMIEKVRSLNCSPFQRESTQCSSNFYTLESRAGLNTSGKTDKFRQAPITPTSPMCRTFGYPSTENRAKPFFKEERPVSRFEDTKYKADEAALTTLCRTLCESKYFTDQTSKNKESAKEMPSKTSFGHRRTYESIPGNSQIDEEAECHRTR